MPDVCLITGPMAAGKSTVARALAERFDRGVHLEGDVFRRSIVKGREEMTPDPTPAALEQLSPSIPARGRRGRCIRGGGVLGRAGGCRRRPDARGVPDDDPSPLPCDRPPAESTPRIGTWLDTTHLTPDETADRIMAIVGRP